MRVEPPIGKSKAVGMVNVHRKVPLVFMIEAYCVGHHAQIKFPFAVFAL